MRLIDERIAEYEICNDNLAWAKLEFDEGLAALERSEIHSSEEYARRMDVLMARLRS